MFEITRRDLIVSSAVAAAMFGLNGRMAFLGVASAQQAKDQGFLRYRVGSIEVTAVSDGMWEKAHDPAYIQNATVEQTKAALAAGGLPTDFVPVPFTPYLVKVGGQLVLVDSGTGGGQTGGPKAGIFMKNLAAAGMDAGEIKTILITHFHPDHISGLMTKAPENRPVFPNAVIHVAASEYSFWMDPAVIEKLPEARRPLAKRIQEMFPLMKVQVSQFSGDKEVVPGIRPIEAQGHTPGHVAYHVSSGQDQLLLVGDSINIPALFVKNPGWHGAFDQDAAKAEATRRMLLERVVAEKITIAGFHFPFPAVGTIGKDGPGYAYMPM
jgi:glyoxylase-like metal-dependent hydrolase (beta-lactamase superfamily II)